MALMPPTQLQIVHRPTTTHPPYSERTIFLSIDPFQELEVKLRMSPASRSKSKDKKASKEPPKASPKPSSHANATAGVPASGYNPAPVSFAGPLHVNGRFRNIDETDDQSGNSFGTGVEYDSVSNNGSWSGESEDQKEKMSHPPQHQESVPGADNDKRDKIRQKNERKHQRQKERRAQELHERCSGYLMSRKLEKLAQQLVAMGFSQERATMALILNEGRVEESVAWLFEAGEEDKHREKNLDGGGNLKIDISEELACITDMEIRHKASKQEVERAVVACEGDLEKAEETLKAQKQELPTAPSKPEETSDPPTAGNGYLPIAISQNAMRAQAKPDSSTTIQQRRDENDFNYAKVPGTVGSSVESGTKNVQSLKKMQLKMEWAKPQQISVLAEKRWPSAGSNPSMSYSLTSPLQAQPPSTRTEVHYAVGSELKNLQLGSVREPVIMMQRPQSMNAKHVHTPSVSSSPPGTAVGRYPTSAGTMKPNGLVRPVIVARSLSPDAVSSNRLNLCPAVAQLDSRGTSRGNSLWNKAGTSPTLSAASSLGLFSGLGTNGASGSSSPVDWNTGSSMLHLDYANIDWSLDRGSSRLRPGELWSGTNSFMQNNTRTYGSFAYGLGMSTKRPVLPNGNGIPIPGLQDRVATSETTAGGSREWTSPFEEKDLFSVPRQLPLVMAMFLRTPTQTCRIDMVAALVSASGFGIEGQVFCNTRMELHWLQDSKPVFQGEVR
ncbi:Ubiquitin-associated/translation elongation factor EF1B protein [Forsythia ovata]|uniref:Ubiquitin-associated/translation elongation factor EF1B protein n=1 Tax=Forsythia ovata TaxID=205694 RepID=A0ABD1VF53_9LAMI